MNAREMAENYRLVHWARLISERHESGLSIKAFCIKAGFHQNRYYYWQRKLRQAALAQIVETKTASPQTDLPTPCFAEVRLAPAPKQSENTMPGRLCVEFGGMQISTDSDYPPEKLAILLRELVRSC